jgi:hypothetical protein
MEERTSDDRKRHESTDDMYDALGDFGHPRRGCSPSDISSTSSEEDEPVPKRSAPQTRKKAPGTRPWMSAARRRRHDAEEARRRRAAEFGWLRDPRERVQAPCREHGWLLGPPPRPADVTLADVVLTGAAFAEVLRFAGRRGATALEQAGSKLLYDACRAARQSDAFLPPSRKVCLVGGLPAKSFDLRSVQWYDCDENVWLHGAVAPLPCAKLHLAAASLGGKIYALGGMRVGWFWLFITNTVDCYEPATRTWEARAPLPTGRFALAAAALNDRIFAIGGLAKWPGHGSAVEAYDATTDRWTAVAALRQPRDGLAAVACSGMLHAIGGQHAFHILGIHEVYDPARDEWAIAAPMLIPRHRLAAVELDGAVFAIGGTTSTVESSTLVERYDKASDRWSACAPLTHPRCDLSAVAVGGKVYVFGGNAKRPLFPCLENRIACRGFLLAFALTVAPRYFALSEPFEVQLPEGGVANVDVCLADSTPLVFDGVCPGDWDWSPPPLEAGGGFCSLLLRGLSRLFCLLALLGFVYWFPRQSVHYVVTSVEMYDPARDMWTDVTESKFSRALHASVVDVSGIHDS